jgi:Asp-tRNA(Asn)/Glu-tRNA(Gln) amidotransferase A subunit family amidase
MNDLAPRLAEGAVQAQELMSLCLAQIAAHDQRGAGLAAILTLASEAEADASRLDGARRSGLVAGPLHGIPLVIKDNIDLAGHPTTSGNPMLARAVAARDAEQTRRLRQAGALILAKTHLSEFSFEVRSRSSLGGDVRNPFDRSVTAGGSSGGSAAAVAAGFAVAALGTDTGGSLRIPAAFNGLVALRPTHGWLDLRGTAPLAPSTDTIGPMARCVKDVARLLGVMAPAGDAAEFALEVDPRDGLRGRRIGVLRQAVGEEGVIEAAMQAALGVMATAGARLIDPLRLPTGVPPIGDAAIVDWEFRTAFDRYLRTNFSPGDVPASLAEIVRSGRFLPDYRDSLAKRLALGPLSNPIYREVLTAHQRLRSALLDLMDRERLTAIVYPTSQVLPSSLDNPAVGWAPELAARSGWPAITLPVGRSPRGLPIGLELLARPRAEGTLLRLAHDLEQRLGGRPVPDLGRLGPTRDGRNGLSSTPGGLSGQSAWPDPKTDVASANSEPTKGF